MVKTKITIQTVPDQRLLPLLDHLARGRHAGGAQELLQLAQRLLVGCALEHADRQRPLPGPGVGDARCRVAVALGRASVS